MFNYPRGKGPKPYLNGGSIKRTRGRPKGSGVNPEKTITAIRVTERVKLMLDGWKKDFRVSTYDEAIKAYCKETIKLRKKVDGLLEGRQPMVVEPRQNIVKVTPNLKIDWRESMR